LTALTRHAHDGRPGVGVYMKGNGVRVPYRDVRRRSGGLRKGTLTPLRVKDSGNDLIAVNGREFRAVSVRTTTSLTYNKPDAARLYHVLAVVHLVGDDRVVDLDASEIFLIPQADVANAPSRCDRLEQYRFTRQTVQTHFGNLVT